nr:MAG TPA: hypothetical protein [Caudoviricetes sp.]
MPTPPTTLLPCRLPYNCQNNNNCRVIIFYKNYFSTSLFFINRYLMENKDVEKSTY